MSALLFLLLALATASPWTPASRDYAWDFPRDHWPHDGYRTEWWYFVGFLEGEDRELAFQFTLFRSGLTRSPSENPVSPWDARHALMGHAALADLATGARVFSQTAHREAPELGRVGAFPEPEIAWMRGPPGTAEGWSVAFRDGAFRIRATDRNQGMEFDLRARPTRPPLLQGDAGYSEKSEGGGASLYYSHPRLEVVGVAGFGGEPAPVRGTAWMDREFGSDWLAPEQVGWDWFALNLDDGRDLMLYNMRGADGAVVHSSATLRLPDGRKRHPEVEVRAQGRFTPEDGGPAYPLGWRLLAPTAEGLDLTLVPRLDDQENRIPRGAPGPDIPYWEGAVRVLRDGAPAGRGFVELTGYRVPMNLLLSGLRPAPEAAPPEEDRDTMMDSLSAVIRWLHIFVGIIWIGHLYFFNFVNAPMAAKLDGPTKQKVVPELMPRALYWFRWGAAWTWITGVVLMLLVFYHGGLTLDFNMEWGVGPLAMVALTFLAVFGYDSLWSSPLRRNVRAATLASFLMLAVTVFLFVEVGGFQPRAVLIHTGAMFGTMMAFNVWFRIWPAQKRIIAAVRDGKAPDASDPALAALRSKHNTYMSLPLLWAMMNEHAFPFFGGNLGIPGEYYWVAWLAIIAIAWHVIFQCYRIAGRVSGM